MGGFFKERACKFLKHICAEVLIIKRLSICLYLAHFASSYIGEIYNKKVKNSVRLVFSQLFLKNNNNNRKRTGAMY